MIDLVLPVFYVQKAIEMDFHFWIRLPPSFLFWLSLPVVFFCDMMFFGLPPVCDRFLFLIPCWDTFSRCCFHLPGVKHLQFTLVLFHSFDGMLFATSHFLKPPRSSPSLPKGWADPPTWSLWQMVQMS